MPKNRHFTFGDMQAQKAREQNLAKLRAMMKTAEAPVPDESEPASTEAEASARVGKPASKKPAPKKTAGKKVAAKKKGK